MIVRYVDDRLRSRVAGMRLTVAFGISSLAVWLLGPLVKSMGFAALLWTMAAIAAVRTARFYYSCPTSRRPSGPRLDPALRPGQARARRLAVAAHLEPREVRRNRPFISICADFAGKKC